MGLTRISDVGRWTTCEAWAMAGRVTVVQRKPVAAWVGTMAHQFLAGGERASDFKQPSRHSVAFDSVTPLPSAAISQARDVAIEAEALLGRYGLKIFDSELSVHEEGVYRGVVDMLVMDRQNRAGVLDLKTGRDCRRGVASARRIPECMEGRPSVFCRDRSRAPVEGGTCRYDHFQRP